MRAILFFFLATTPTFGEGRFVFEETLVGVEAGPNDDFVDAKFPFKVEGEGKAVVRKFEAPCSCLDAKIGKEDRIVWQPGEEGFVTGTFEVGTFRGTVQKKIHITMANGKRHALTVAMTTPKLLTIEPKTLKWKVGEDAVPKTLKVTLDPNYPVNIESVENSNLNQFEQELETIVEGKEYLLRLTPKSTSSHSLGVIRFTTDSKNKRHKTYQAFVVVEKKTPGPQRRSR